MQIFPVPRVSKMLGWLKTQTRDKDEAEKRQNALKIYNKLLPAQKSQFLAKFVQNRKERCFDFKLRRFPKQEFSQKFREL